MTALSLSLVVPWAAGTVLALLDGRRRRDRLGRRRGARGEPRRPRRARRRGVARRTGRGDDRRLAGRRRDHAARRRARGRSSPLLSSLVAACRDRATRCSTACASGRFPGLVVLLAAGLTGVFLTGDLFNFYVFFELAMTAAYVLATYGGGTARARRGARLHHGQPARHVHLPALGRRRLPRHRHARDGRDRGADGRRRPERRRCSSRSASSSPSA